MSREHTRARWCKKAVAIWSTSGLLHHGLLLLFAIMAYWPLSSFHHATRWDSVETYFPFRYFISDCLRNGELPLWMPYQLGGYPFYADPQSGAWYPVVWILCSIAPYTLKSLAAEFVLSVFIGGAGMYRLTRSFNPDARVALITGISYSACGFFISNAEHITWVVSAAWLPWVFWSYHRAVVTNRYGYSLLTGLMLFLLLSGGYPAFITVALYLLIVFFLVLVLRRQPAAVRRRLIGIHVCMAAAFLIVSAGTMLSWYQAYPFISRGAGLSLQDIFVHPFSPRCAESFLLPFLTLKGLTLYDSDISMRNAYMGLCTILMLPFAAVNLRSRKLVLIALLAVFCLTAALGAYLPVREWLYRFVPMMHMFRFPSLFRIFFIIGTILIAGHGIYAFQKNIPGNRAKLAIIISLLVAGLSLAFAVSVMKHGFSWQWGHTIHSFKEHLLHSPRREHIQLQCMLQIGLLSLLLFACLYRRGALLSVGLLLIFCVTDMFLASSLNAYGTVVAYQPLSEQESPITAAPRHFPAPDNHIAVSAYSDKQRRLGLLLTNTSMYFKTPAADGYNTFLLNSFNRLDASSIRDSVRANPYLYFADGLSIGTDKTPLPSKAALRVDTATYQQLALLSRHAVPGRNVQVRRFLPNRISAVAYSSDSALLNLQQNYFEGWRISLDSSRVRPFITNYAQMAVLIPPGSHRIDWSFNPPYIRAMIVLTICSLLLLSATLVIFRRRLL